MNKGQGIDRVFSIIETISANQNGLSLSEVTKLTNLPKPTVLRTINELIERAFLTKDSYGRYHLGYKIVQMASIYLADLDVRDICEPIMREISKELNVAVHLATLADDKCVYIKKINPFNFAICYSEIGQTNELYCSALGKIFLASFNDEKIKEYFKNHDLKKYTENTLSKKELINEITKIRSEGISKDNAEREDNVFCIAAPITNYKNEIIAAISLTSRSSEITSNSLYISKLKEYAKSISKTFGMRG